MTIEVENSEPPEWMIALENKQKRVSYGTFLDPDVQNGHLKRCNRILMYVAAQIGS